ncbi:hypothetical protein B0H14DRAFT_3550421 [Mycena olivaceomarginata]|nr:hypothetical protein B0H14DRAFT_3550421 [Mycena olivaceomarginata]
MRGPGGCWGGMRGGRGGGGVGGREEGGEGREGGAWEGVARESEVGESWGSEGAEVWEEEREGEAEAWEQAAQRSTAVAGAAEHSETRGEWWGMGPYETERDSEIRVTHAFWREGSCRNRRMSGTGRRQHVRFRRNGRGRGPRGWGRDEHQRWNGAGERTCCTPRGARGMWRAVGQGGKDVPCVLDAAQQVAQAAAAAQAA